MPGVTGVSEGSRITTHRRVSRVRGQMQRGPAKEPQVRRGNESKETEREVGERRAAEETSRKHADARAEGDSASRTEMHVS